MAYSYVPFEGRRLPLILEGTARKRMLILAHGMRSGMKSPLLNHISHFLSTRCALTVARFSFPYAVEGRRSPNVMAVLQRSYRAVRGHLLNKHAPDTLVCGGVSLGARVVGNVEVEDRTAAGLLFLGYPLHPPNQPKKERVLPFDDYGRPLLFIQGRRDALAYVERMVPLVKGIPDARHLIVEKANHSFAPRKRDGIAVETIYDEVAGHIADWIETF